MGKAANMEAQVITGVKEVLDGWAAIFTIGVQTFSLAPVETKERAEWYEKMLKIAFKNIGHTAINPASVLDFVGGNYAPIINNGSEVMWNLDGPEALYTSKEVFEDYLEKAAEND
jgi:hypothetical protein